MFLEDLALVGNCQFSALIDKTGSVVWCCLPRFDSEPIFSTLLDEKNGGSFIVGDAENTPGTQNYLDNTNVLETRFETSQGSFRVIDFAPRFIQHDRSFRPTKLVRIIEPLRGTPLVRVLCQPKLGWSKELPKQQSGSHHVTYLGFPSELRLTTDIPISYLTGQPFALTETRYLVLSWGEPVEEPLQPLCDRFYQQTARYWRSWVKHCDVPPLFQKEVIRSALALKLHCYEDTGAIVAAMTTSIPESVGSGRTWDYRFCWLRDAYYALGAFRLLGHFEEREQFVTFLLNIAASAPDLDLAPLYRVDARRDLEESILSDWPGFNNDGPVRIGNQAAEHRQNDIYGEMVLALAPIFIDDRFRQEQSKATLDLLVRLARKAISVAGLPDAGIWEYRADWKPQTFSSLMCWAAADRVAKVAVRHLPELAPEFANAAQRIQNEILEKAWNPRLGSFVASYGGEELDAALLQAVTIRFLPWEDARLRGSVDAIFRGLNRNGWMYRYQLNDGFGVPSVAFVICTFWLIEALARLGRTSEARAMLEQVCAKLTPLGLVAEDWDTQTERMSGNFPQAYSHVGLIHAAFASSPRWAEVL